MGERVGARGRDLLAAMVIGYETAGRMHEVRDGGVRGLHATQLVAIGGAALSAKLMKQTTSR